MSAPHFRSGPSAVKSCATRLGATGQACSFSLKSVHWTDFFTLKFRHALEPRLLARDQLVLSHQPRRLGNAHPNIVPYQLFPTSDGHLFIACGNDRQFVALCRVLGRPDLAQDADFATNPARVANCARLVPLLAQATQAMTRADLIAALEGAGVPGGPVNDVAEALADPQVAARGLQIAPEGIAGLRSPMRFSRSPLVTERAAPALGEGEWRFRDGTD